jgi:hypothetical protein
VAIRLLAPSSGELSAPVSLQYVLSDAQSRPFDVHVLFSLDGGATFQPASEAAGAGSDGVAQLASSPAGTTYTFVWDAARDLPLWFASGVVFRVAAFLIQASGADVSAPVDVSVGSLGGQTADISFSDPFAASSPAPLARVLTQAIDRVRIPTAQIDRTAVLRARPAAPTPPPPPRQTPSTPPMQLGRPTFSPAAQAGYQMGVARQATQAHQATQARQGMNPSPFGGSSYGGAMFLQAPSQQRGGVTIFGGAPQTLGHPHSGQMGAVTLLGGTQIVSQRGGVTVFSQDIGPPVWQSQQVGVVFAGENVGHGVTGGDVNNLAEGTIVQGKDGTFYRKTTQDDGTQGLQALKDVAPDLPSGKPGGIILNGSSPLDFGKPVDSNNLDAVDDRTFILGTDNKPYMKVTQSDGTSGLLSLASTQDDGEFRTFGPQPGNQPPLPEGFAQLDYTKPDSAEAQDRAQRKIDEQSFVQVVKDVARTQSTADPAAKPVGVVLDPNQPQGLGQVVRNRDLTRLADGTVFMGSDGTYYVKTTQNGAPGLLTVGGPGFANAASAGGAPAFTSLVASRSPRPTSPDTSADFPSVPPPAQGTVGMPVGGVSTVVNENGNEVPLDQFLRAHEQPYGVSSGDQSIFKITDAQLQSAKRAAATANAPPLPSASLDTGDEPPWQPPPLDAAGEQAQLGILTAALPKSSPPDDGIPRTMERPGTGTIAPVPETLDDGAPATLPTYTDDREKQIRQGMVAQQNLAAAESESILPLPPVSIFPAAPAPAVTATGPVGPGRALQELIDQAADLRQKIADIKARRELPASIAPAANWIGDKTSWLVNLMTGSTDETTSVSIPSLPADPLAILAAATGVSDTLPGEDATTAITIVHRDSTYLPPTWLSDLYAMTDQFGSFDELKARQTELAETEKQIALLQSPSSTVAELAYRQQEAQDYKYQTVGTVTELGLPIAHGAAVHLLPEIVSGLSGLGGGESAGTTTEGRPSAQAAVETPAEAPAVEKAYEPPAVEKAYEAPAVEKASEPGPKVEVESPGVPDVELASTGEKPDYGTGAERPATKEDVTGLRSGPVEEAVSRGVDEKLTDPLRITEGGKNAVRLGADRVPVVHTHPEDTGGPSVTDLDTAVAIGKQQGGHMEIVIEPSSKWYYGWDGQKAYVLRAGPDGVPRPDPEFTDFLNLKYNSGQSEAPTALSRGSVELAAPTKSRPPVPIANTEDAAVQRYVEADRAAKGESTPNAAQGTIGETSRVWQLKQSGVPAKNLNAEVTGTNNVPLVDVVSRQGVDSVKVHLGSIDAYPEELRLLMPVDDARLVLQKEAAQIIWDNRANIGDAWPAELADAEGPQDVLDYLQEKGRIAVPEDQVKDVRAAVVADAREHPENWGLDPHSDSWSADLNALRNRVVGNGVSTQTARDILVNQGWLKAPTAPKVKSK